MRRSIAHLGKRGAPVSKRQLKAQAYSPKPKPPPQNRVKKEKSLTLQELVQPTESPWVFAAAGISLGEIPPVVGRCSLNADRYFESNGKDARFVTPAEFGYEVWDSQNFLFTCGVSLILTEFVHSQLPSRGVPEIAFAGRSNVGKSTLLAALMDRSASKVGSDSFFKTSCQCVHAPNRPGFAACPCFKNTRMYRQRQLLFFWAWWILGRVGRHARGKWAPSTRHVPRRSPWVRPPLFLKYCCGFLSAHTPCPGTGLQKSTRTRGGLGPSSSPTFCGSAAS